MQIKVKMLLPPEQGEEEELDPRANLIQRLVEYKRYKEMSLQMKNREEEQMNVHYRGYRSADEHIVEEETGEDMIRDVTFFDLIASFKFAMDRMPKKFFHEIDKINVTVEEQIAYIEEYFLRRSEATFYDLVKDFSERIRIVVTFLALLEVIRTKKIIVRQLRPFGDLSIMRNVN
jgi:segregation and condensation protein A